MANIRKQTTVYLDSELLRAARDLAADSGRHVYEVIEEALSQYVSAARADTRRQALCELLNELDDDAELSDEEALRIAYAELHAARRQRQPE